MYRYLYGFEEGDQEMEQLKMLGLSEARTKLFDLADESKPTLLLRHSSPRAVLVPYAAWVKLQVEIEDLKGAVAGYRSRTNSPQLRLPTDNAAAEFAPRIDLERNARRLSEVLDLAERLPHRPRRKIAYPPFLRRLQ